MEKAEVIDAPSPVTAVIGAAAVCCGLHVVFPNSRPQPLSQPEMGSETVRHGVYPAMQGILPANAKQR
jgi:hypothetical protein